ncbi:hypothetical protein N7539_001567 [Penicillium diatomitis]|uniref:Hypervirulence associated protein TUDOR domain-containing protein n=1 Tax=Penicillium diatomitis TaxID=2819901 RepID=A0A9X0C009_9EURO|nr:uncharacterized protein N7539_001567 [Penicillium diatomitis]KAJ5492821.1 hypothetical protein N7539_001567 [Penicillium diatomitis]
MPAFQTGQRVSYKPVGGRESHTSESVGVIRDVSTHDTTMTGRRVEASPGEPRYEVCPPSFPSPHVHEIQFLVDRETILD